jgi:hypothetical protein
MSAPDNPVWFFFTRRDGANHCNCCEWKEKDSSFSTTNLWRHLESKAHNISKDVVTKIKPPPPPDPSPRITNFFGAKSKLEMKMLTVMLICVDLLPLSVTEGEGASPLFPAFSDLFSSIYRIFSSDSWLGGPCAFHCHSVGQEGLRIRAKKYVFHSSWLQHSSKFSSRSPADHGEMRGVELHGGCVEQDGKGISLRKRLLYRRRLDSPACLLRN